MVRTGRHTVSAPETAGINLADDTGIHIIVRGGSRTNRHTGRMSMVSFTMLARPWKKAFLSVRKRFTVRQLVDAHPRDTYQLVGFIFPKGDIVLCHTGNHTCATTCAFIQINDFHLHPLVIITSWNSYKLMKI
jgi:hypothetical protein